MANLEGGANDDLLDAAVAAWTALNLPRLDDDDRAFWYTCDRLRCSFLHSAGFMGLEASFRVGFARHPVRFVVESAGGVAAMVRESVRASAIMKPRTHEAYAGEHRATRTSQGGSYAVFSPSWLR
jgi:hypothetical protein